MIFGRILAVLRRSRGLSQLDLATLSGVAQRHISFLETGRSRPGHGAASKLADALDLTLDERSVFALAALGLSPAVDEAEPPTSDEARDSVARLIQAIVHPAVAVDAAGNVLASNNVLERAIEAVSPDAPLWDATCEEQRNLYELSLHPRGLLRHMVDAPALVSALMQRLRFASLSSREAALVLGRIRRRLPPHYHHARAITATPPVPISVETYAVAGRHLRFRALEWTLAAREAELRNAVFVNIYEPIDEETLSFVRPRDCA